MNVFALICVLCIAVLMLYDSVSNCTVMCHVIILTVKLVLYMASLNLLQDTRMVDPNFVKLFKLAQFLIEYLEVCHLYALDLSQN